MTILEELQEYKKANNWEMGLELLESINSSMSDEMLDEYGWFLSRGKQYEKAIDVYAELIKRHPDFAKYYYMLGYQYYDQTKYYESISWFEKALSISPDYFAVKYRLSYSYSKLVKKCSFQDEYFSKCISLLENAHKQYNSFDDSAKEKNKSDYSNICYLHGKQIATFSKYNDKAIDLFKTAINLDPDNINKHYQLAKKYFNMGRNQDASDALLLADKLYIKALNTEILSALGKFDELEKSIYPNITNSKCATVEYFLSIIRAYIKQEKYQKALIYAKKAVSKHYKSYKCHNALGYCYEKLEMFKSAIDEYEKSELITKDYPTDNDAKKHINEILKLTDNNPCDKIVFQEDADVRKTGIITQYYNERGFGFVLGDDENKYFFHVSKVKDGYTPAKNDKVKFELGAGRKGVEAINVIQVENI